MYEVATGAETAVLVLMEVAAHLLAECGLMLRQLFYPVCEETVLAIDAEAALCKTATELQLALRSRMRQTFVSHLAHQTYYYYFPVQYRLELARRRLHRPFPSLSATPRPWVWHGDAEFLKMWVFP